jgi:hypothetical protein
METPQARVEELLGPPPVLGHMALGRMACLLGGQPPRLWVYGIESMITSF